MSLTFINSLCYRKLCPAHRYNSKPIQATILLLFNHVEIAANQSWNISAMGKSLDLMFFLISVK